jgi:hypothetical protein
MLNFIKDDLTDGPLNEEGGSTLVRENDWEVCYLPMYYATNHIFHSRIWSYHILVGERGEEVDH